MDLFLVVCAAPLWLPLTLLLAMGVRLVLGRPIFFTQERAGLGAVPFRLLKFRTMTDATDPSGRLLPDRERLTSFGHWLRATSLDELPELFLVLRGQMSLVGPRPLLTSYTARYSPRQARRLSVPPGITGWAQVNGRNAISWEERFELDLWYVEHRSLWLDLRILGRTIYSVLSREGINPTGQDSMPEFQGQRDQSGSSFLE